MKLAMTANEIKQRHRNGASVQILSELNNTTVDIIEDVLNDYTENYELTKEQKEQLFFELYRQGLNDKQIAKRLNMNRKTVWYWRNRDNLPINK